jgi:membrane protein
VSLIRLWYRAALLAYDRMNADDGWAIASHIALSALLAMFPFLLVLTALAGFLGTKGLADEVADLMLTTWPVEVSGPIAGEIHKVLTVSRGDILTVGTAFAIYFASAGIESLRIGLNRAYGVAEARNWVLLRLESIGYVLVSAVSMIALGFLIVLGPLAFAAAKKYAPFLATLEDPLLAKIENIYTIARYGIASFVLVVALVLVHKWLPAGRRTLREITPGIVVTLLLWMLCGMAFGSYLAEFAYTYVTYYAGLASAAIALVFLYLIASIFIYGAELNTVIGNWREKQRSVAAEDGQP